MPRSHLRSSAGFAGATILGEARLAEVELPKPDELHEHATSSFSRRGALVTAIYAVVLAQQQSSDQWAFYQAKVIREHLYRAQRMRLEADLADRAPAAAREKHEALLQIAIVMSSVSILARRGSPPHSLPAGERAG